MSESTVVRAFEIRVIRPWGLMTILATLLAAIARHWWSTSAGVVALFAFGMIGASLHPMQSFDDLVEGPLEGQVARIEQRGTSDEIQRLLVSRACTYLAVLLGGMFVWTGFAILNGRWFVILPGAYALAALIGRLLKSKFVLAPPRSVDSLNASV
jgi:hypothetical protein